MAIKKRILLLGASGSIGMQTIDVIHKHSDQFELVGVSVGSNIDALIKILNTASIKYACVANKKDQSFLEKKYPHIFFYSEDIGLEKIVEINEYDLLVNAVVGARGLIPTLSAIEHDKDIALANKESLVVGGMLVKQALAKHPNVHLYPIDSEHSAIFQCLRGNQTKAVRKLIITASGGSFRDKTREELIHVTKEEALHHPNWEMGGRITIDSATMMNKGFEVIEAMYLFDMPLSKIKTIMHKESAVHSMVEYQDNAIIAQIGTADMRLPIQYALSYPERLQTDEIDGFDFDVMETFHFEPIDLERFPLLKIAYEVGAKGGNLGAIMNAADEEAVALFLDETISFLDIEVAIMTALSAIPFIEEPTLEEILISDQQTRVFVRSMWKEVMK